MDIVEKFIRQISYKFPKGYPDMNNEHDVVLLNSLLEDLGVDLNEKLGVKGFEAEQELYNLLKQYNKLPEDQGPPAGSSGWDVDLSFLNKNNDKYNLEVKAGLPDFGQLELKWNAKKGWHFLDYSPESNKEKFEIVQSLRDSGVEQTINNVWGKPNRYSKENMTMEDRKEDYQNFKDIYLEVPKDFIIKYYKGKNVNYINIKGYGLYKLDGDPADTGASLFNPSESKIRIRIKSRKSSDPKGYGFLGALKISGLPKSKIDLNNPNDIINALDGFTDTEEQ